MEKTHDTGISAMNSSLYQQVTDLIFEEAEYLDQKNWSSWLNLYSESCIFWAPAWINEHIYTTHPDEELNLLYLKGKQNLIDRVFRIETGDSFASLPMDRTAHLISNIRITGSQDKHHFVNANWLVHSYGIRDSLTRGGSYQFIFEETHEGLKILQKKIVMINDKLVGPVDIYHL
jgi:benzoate/toluate 1,2-dioxygenase subunit beta